MDDDDEEMPEVPQKKDKKKDKKAAQNGEKKVDAPESDVSLDRNSSNWNDFSISDCHTLFNLMVYSNTLSNLISVINLI